MMKRFLLVCIAALALTANAGAQVFDHLSVGLGLGTDGISLELAAPLGDHIDFRAGYGFGPGLIGINVGSVAFPVHPGAPSGPSAGVPLQLKLGMSDARLLFNFYPGHGGFHITVGAYMGSPRVVRALLSNMPSDYNTAGIEVDGYLVKASAGSIPASIYAKGIGGTGYAVKPYVGVGYGRAVPDKRVGFSIDLGAQYQGKPTVWARGEGVTGRTKDVEITDSFAELKNAVEKYGKYTAFWPTLTFHLYVKLF